MERRVTRLGLEEFEAAISLEFDLMEESDNKPRSEGWQDVSQLRTSPRQTVADCLICEPIKRPCGYVIRHLLVPVRCVERQEPSPELGPLGRWQLLNRSLNFFKGAHKSHFT